jgi:hypothetical protein
MMLCIPFNFLDMTLVDDTGFVLERPKGFFHAMRSDEVHSFRAKNREDRFEACVARLRPMTYPRAAPGVIHI